MSSVLFYIMQWPIENIIPVYYLVFYCSLSPFSFTHVKIALPNNILAHIHFSQALLSGEPMLRKWITNTALWRLPWYSVHLLSSLQFSHSVMSDSLWPHVLQHTRPPCPSPTPEFIQTHVHWVGDAIQPSHPLLSPSPPTFNLSQHQGLFKWVSSSHQVAKVLELQLQHQSFQWIFRTDFL